MIEIQNINLKNKTIDNVKCSYENVKDLQMSMIRNTFTVNVNIMKVKRLRQNTRNRKRMIQLKK